MREGRRRQAHCDRRALHRDQGAGRRLHAHPGEVTGRGARMGPAFPQSRSEGRRDRGAPAVRAGRFRSQRGGRALPQAGPRVSQPEGVLRIMKKFASVAAYLRAVPPAPRAALQKLRKTIKAAAPKATEAISYGIPMFKHHGMLVGYAAFKDHCSLFMSTVLAKAYKKALAPYQTSKGTIRFTVEKPLPTTLVRKLVKARIAQNERKR